jgi:molybdopterin-binding protein
MSGGQQQRGDRVRVRIHGTPAITAEVQPAVDDLKLDGVRLVASITVEAVRQLGLAEGNSVTAVIKASDVILATGD